MGRLNPHVAAKASASRARQAEAAVAPFEDAAHAIADRAIRTTAHVHVESAQIAVAHLRELAE